MNRSDRVIMSGMRKTIPIMSTIAIIALVSAIPSTLAVITNNDTMTPPMTTGFHIWHGSPYVVCPPGIPAPCANQFPLDFNATWWKLYGGAPYISGR